VALALWAAVGALSGYFLNSQIHLMDRILSRSAWVIVALAALYVGARAIKERDGAARRSSKAGGESREIHERTGT